MKIYTGDQGKDECGAEKDPEECGNIPCPGEINKFIILNKYQLLNPKLYLTLREHTLS